MTEDETSLKLNLGAVIVAFSFFINILIVVFMDSTRLGGSNFIEPHLNFLLSMMPFWIEIFVIPLFMIVTVILIISFFLTIGEYVHYALSEL